MILLYEEYSVSHDERKGWQRNEANRKTTESIQRLRCSFKRRSFPGSNRSCWPWDAPDYGHSNHDIAQQNTKGVWILKCGNTKTYNNCKYFAPKRAEISTNFYQRIPSIFHRFWGLIGNQAVVRVLLSKLCILDLHTSNTIARNRRAKHILCSQAYMFK